MAPSRTKCAALAIVLGTIAGVAVALLTQHIGGYLLTGIAVIAVLLGCSAWRGKVKNYPLPPLVRN